MMFREDGNRPSDVRGFIHKSKFGRFVGGVAGGLIENIPVVGTGVRIAKRVISTVRAPARATRPRGERARPSILGEQEKELGREIKFISSTVNGVRAPARLPALIPGGGFAGTAPRPRAFGGNGEMRAGPCDFPMVLDSAGRCRTPTSGEFGGEQFGVGEAVMGRFGAALEPGSKIIDRAICLRGMVLGNDGLCYNKTGFRNSDRMWPRGRRPLLTGGEMRAIGIASSAAKRVERTKKRLESMGMLRKAAPRRALPRHQHALPAPAVSVH